jgi:acid stress-induced BolA-like protein IbaG/YrbA
MAERTVTEPTYVGQLVTALQKRLSGAQVDYECVRRDRYRFVVVYDRFEGVGHPERQRLVWDLAEAVLDKSSLPNVAMIITMAPSEVPAD